YDAGTGAWTMQTDGIRRVVRFADGSLLQTSLVNRASGRELQQSGKSSEFRVRVAGVDHRGSTGAWTLDGHQVTERADGALVLTIDLHDAVLGVRRTYVVYPGTAVIEERTDVTNRTSAAISVTDYAAMSMRVLGDDAAHVDLLTMSGDKAATTPWHQLRSPVAMTTGTQTLTGRGGNVNAEFVSLRDRTTGDGVVVTWDYTGTWGLTVGDSYGRLLIEPRATVATPLAAGATITGPLGRIGLYQGDVDDMGNAVLDFTYRYLWDHTDDEYFPLVRYGGYGSDPTTVAQKIDQLAYLGGDMVWIDDGWQDAVGDWNDRPGEPIAEYRDLAARYGQSIGLWLVPWGAEAGSAVAAAHPGWMVDATNRKAGLDTSLPGVVDHVRATLDARQDEFGPFMLKTDFGADSGDLAKADATMQILDSFVTDNPDASLQLCSDGGGLLNLGTAGLSSLVLQQDGTGTRADGYWSSLLYPSEKLIATYGRTTIGSTYQPGNRHLLSFHLTVAGDT
ncbi:MAG TPA: glycoside hydrolase family 36 N-terminal domain-containing protein, partial [Cellulomonas sp.]